MEIPIPKEVKNNPRLGRLIVKTVAEGKDSFIYKGKKYTLTKIS